MLWFKNVIIYRLKMPLKLSSAQLEQQLSAFAFTPCGSQDVVKFGWVPPMGTKSDTLVKAIPGHFLLCLNKEEKIIPSSVIKHELQGNIAKLENKERRKLRKIEKDVLRDEVLHTLVPRAFSRFSKTLLWLDLVTNLVLIDAISAKKAEECLALLRKSIGSLPVVPLTMKRPIELILTDWVSRGDPTAGFFIQDEAELKAILEEGGIVRCKKQDLSSEEIAGHIKAGKLVTQLALDWRERIQFILSGDGMVKRLKFSNKLRAQNADLDCDGVAARFTADFILMTSELAALITELMAAISG